MRTTTDNELIYLVILLRYWCRGFPESPTNVSLTSELEKLVHVKVESGRYTSASEAFARRFVSWEQRDQLQELHKDDIRAKIAGGAASMRAGNSVDGEGVSARMMKLTLPSVTAVSPRKPQRP